MKVWIFIITGIVFLFMNDFLVIPWWVCLSLFVATDFVSNHDRSGKKQHIIFTISLCLSLLFEIPEGWPFFVALGTALVCKFWYKIGLRKNLNITSSISLGLAVIYWMYFLITTQLDFIPTINHLYTSVVLKTTQLFIDLLTFFCSYILILEMYNEYMNSIDDFEISPPLQVKYTPAYTRAGISDLSGDMTNIQSDLESWLKDLHEQKYDAELILKRMQAYAPVVDKSRNKNDNEYSYGPSYAERVNARIEEEKTRYINLIAKIDEEIKRGNERLNEIRLKAPKYRGFSNPKDFGTIDGLSSSPFYDTE